MNVSPDRDLRLLEKDILMKGGLSGQIDHGPRWIQMFAVLRIRRPKYGIDVGLLVALGVLEIMPTTLASG